MPAHFGTLLIEGLVLLCGINKCDVSHEKIIYKEYIYIYINFISCFDLFCYMKVLTKLKGKIFELQDMYMVSWQYTLSLVLGTFKHFIVNFILIIGLMQIYLSQWSHRIAMSDFIKNFNWNFAYISHFQYIQYLFYCSYNSRFLSYVNSIFLLRCQKLLLIPHLKRSI